MIMKALKLIQKVFIFSTLVSSLIFANTIHVPGDYPTILLAVNNASNGDTIVVAYGTYYENVLIQNKSVVLIGTDTPIIDGGGDNTCLFLDGTDTNTVITNFKLRNGRYGIRVSASYKGNVPNPSITNNGYKLKNLILNCYYGLYDYYSEYIFIDSSLFSCSSDDYVVHIVQDVNPNTDSRFIKITNSKFNSNNREALKINSYYDYSTPNPRNIIKDCEFKNNSRVGLAVIGSIKIQNCLFQGNSWYGAYNTEYGGASLILNGGGQIVENCRFIDNHRRVIKYSSNASDYSVVCNSVIANNYYNTTDAIRMIEINGNENNIFELINCSFSNNMITSDYEYKSIIMTNGNGIIEKCNFQNNHPIVLYNQNENIFLDAEYNWWGDSTGPYHQTSNPGGAGDTVNLYVDILPFLTSPDTVAPPPIIQNLSIDTIGVDFAKLIWDSSPISDLNGYRLYINENPAVFTFSDTIDVGNDTTYTLNNLTTGATYYVSVTCYDNSGDESWFTENLVVEPSPVSMITAESNQIDFGSVLVGDTVQASLTIYNTGTADLNISNIYTTSPEFVSIDTTLIIPHGSQKDISIIFTPLDFGAFSSDLVISSDAYNKPELIITMLGSGNLSPSPEILSILDVSDDQGGNVRINFSRSKYDGLDSTYKIVSYTVWRLIENNDWDAVGMFNAVQDSFYYFVAPTLGDSTINGIIWSTFKVSAHTENPEIFFYSDSLCGYSIDNIAPGVPEGLFASTSNGNILLTWQPNGEKDFQYYGIYRSTCSNFDPDTMEIYTYATSDTFLYDSNIEGNINYYYRVSAFDYSGNESEYSPEVSAVVVGLQSNGDNLPGEYSLSQNYPNPFNPTTTISYQLPRSSFVKLTIYDISGRLVDKLIDEKKNAGYYTVEWNAENACSGVYFYRIEAGNFVAVKKGLLVK